MTVQGSIAIERLQQEERSRERGRDEVSRHIISSCMSLPLDSRAALPLLASCDRETTAALLLDQHDRCIHVPSGGGMAKFMSNNFYFYFYFKHVELRFACGMVQRVDEHQVELSMDDRAA
jgi:hypothetical protein